jgi:hypothetical protein
MSRADLLALTPEALAALTNPGLLKRAQKEMDAGQGPTVTEAPDGTVTGVFADGVTTTLPPHTALPAASCTCGAATACRHRVEVVLAYAKSGAQKTSTEEAPPEAFAPWSPAMFTNEDIEIQIGNRAMERARKLLRTGPVVVEIRRPIPTSPRPTAKLPTCSVQFMAPRDLTFARCDCSLQHDCEHVAIAVWAFRVADTDHADDAVAHVQVLAETATARASKAAATGKTPRAKKTVEAKEGAPAAGAAAAETPRAAATREGMNLVREILLTGVSRLHEASKQHFARAHDSLAAAGLTWPGTIVEDLEEAWHAYENRSARYHTTDVASLLAEFAARIWAASQPGDVPDAEVLGLGVARDTNLSHVRLISVGARLDADDRDRIADVYLADTEGSGIFVMRAKWTFPENQEPDNGAALSSRAIASGFPLGRVAKGQMVSKGLKRTADHRVALATTKAGTTTVSDPTSDWSALPPSILVTDLEQFEHEWAERPPAFLRPRVVADATRVLAVGAVGAVAYHSGAQRLIAQMEDVTGHPFLLSRSFRSVAPNALPTLAALLQDEAHPVQYVAGDIRHTAHGLEIDPIGVVVDGRLIVPDISDKSLPLNVDNIDEPDADTASMALLRETHSLLADAAHQGLFELSGTWCDRGATLTKRLKDAGFYSTSIALDTLIKMVRVLPQASHRSDDGPRAAEAWLRTAIRVALVTEHATL